MSDQQCPGSPGDIIVFPRPVYGYNHLAINVGGGDIVHVTSISDNPGSLDVAGSFSSTSDRKAQIKKEKYSDFRQPGEKPYVETSWNDKTPLESAEIVRRALSKVGTNYEYSVSKKNCEHFARWCRYDEEVSDQADGLVAGVALVGGICLPPLEHDLKTSGNANNESTLKVHMGENV